MLWHERCARSKEDKVVVKLMKRDGSFNKSVAVPTDYYPLNGKYEVFTYANTQLVQDKSVLEIFNSVKYRIGHCYTYSKELAEKLRAAGYDAITYAGWLFTGSTEFPIHHCWVVLNGETVLDLSDDHTAMLSGENGKYFREAQGKREVRELIASFQSAAKAVPNSIRCSPVGRPTPFLLYVGSPCDPDEARVIYQRLMWKYPGHECERNCDASGLNATQRLMKEKGLMD